MKNDFVYLTIHQAFVLTSRIKELKKNPYFNDPISESFVKEVYKKSAEITANNLCIGTNLLQRIKKNGDKIEVSKSKFEYITRLTKIDVFDEEFMNKYLSRLNETETILDSSKPKLR